MSRFPRCCAGRLRCEVRPILACTISGSALVTQNRLDGFQIQPGAASINECLEDFSHLMTDLENEVAAVFHLVMSRVLRYVLPSGWCATGRRLRAQRARRGALPSASNSDVVHRCFPEQRPYRDRSPMGVGPESFPASVRSLIDLSVARRRVGEDPARCGGTTGGHARRRRVIDLFLPRFPTNRSALLPAYHRSSSANSLMGSHNRLIASNAAIRDHGTSACFSSIRSS